MNTANWLNEAAKLSEIAIENKEGGPFGCIIVKNGKIVGKGYNKVTSTNDPTAHAEILAIRDACSNMGTFQLEGCDIYTSCEPCSMCLGAIYWARPNAVYFANTREDAAAIGFDDAYIYEEIQLPANKRSIPCIHQPNAHAKDIFTLWEKDVQKTKY